MRLYQGEVGGRPITKTTRKISTWPYTAHHSTARDETAMHSYITSQCQVINTRRGVERTPTAGEGGGGGCDGGCGNAVVGCQSREPLHLGSQHVDGAGHCVGSLGGRHQRHLLLHQLLGGQRGGLGVHGLQWAEMGDNQNRVVVHGELPPPSSPPQSRLSGYIRWV